MAVALAESRAAAEDALEGAPLVHEDLGDNLAARLEINVGDAEAELDRAPRRERMRLVVQRAGGGAMEGRALLAQYDPRLRRLTVHASTQTPHLLRRDLALILDLPESSVDVIAPDVGGGFGPKAYTYPEDGVVAWASVQTGRPGEMDRGSARIHPGRRSRTRAGPRYRVRL